MSQPSRCVSCAEVIGVYEPMVVVDHTGVRSTSRAAEPAPHFEGQALYHRGCYERRERAEQPSIALDCGGAAG